MMRPLHLFLVAATLVAGDASAATNAEKARATVEAMKARSEEHTSELQSH